jgi:hypothetical protein
MIVGRKVWNGSNLMMICTMYVYRSKYPVKTEKPLVDFPGEAPA